jgi:hypothetical protein
MRRGRACSRNLARPRAAGRVISRMQGGPACWRRAFGVRKGDSCGRRVAAARAASVWRVVWRWVIGVCYAAVVRALGQRRQGAGRARATINSSPRAATSSSRRSDACQPGGARETNAHLQSAGGSESGQPPPTPVHQMLCSCCPCCPPPLLPAAAAAAAAAGPAAARSSSGGAPHPWKPAARGAGARIVKPCLAAGQAAACPPSGPCTRTAAALPCTAHQPGCSQQVASVVALPSPAATFAMGLLRYRQEPAVEDDTPAGACSGKSP